MRTNTIGKKTQQEYVLEHLQTHGSISPLEALGLYGVYRLAAIIHKLRNNYIIDTEENVTDNGHRYARYWYVCAEPSAKAA